MCITGSPLLQPDPLFLELQTSLSCLLKQCTIILLPPDTTITDHYCSLNSFHLARLIAMIRRQRDEWFVWQFEPVLPLKCKLLQAINLSFSASLSQHLSCNSATSLKCLNHLPLEFCSICSILLSKRGSSNDRTDRQNESLGRDQMKISQSAHHTLCPQHHSVVISWSELSSKCSP